MAMASTDADKASADDSDPDPKIVKTSSENLKISPYKSKYYYI